MNSTVLVIGDSYSLPIAHFLLSNFKNVISLDQRYLERGEVFEYLEKSNEKIDVVINIQNTIDIQSTSFFDFFK